MQSMHYNILISTQNRCLPDLATYQPLRTLMNWIVRSSEIRNRSLHLRQPVDRWVSPRRVNGVLTGVLFLLTKVEGSLARELLEVDPMLTATGNKGMVVDLHRLDRMEAMGVTTVVCHLLEICHRMINHTVSHTTRDILDDLQWSMACHPANQFMKTTLTGTPTQICHLTEMTVVAPHRLGLEYQDLQAVRLR